MKQEGSQSDSLMNASERFDVRLPKPLAECAKDYAKRKQLNVGRSSGVSTLMRIALGEKLNKLGYSTLELTEKGPSQRQEDA